MDNNIKSLLLNLLGIVVTTISPELRAEIVKAVTTMETKAKQTASPIDDVFVKILKFVLVIP
jgi:hypothetical protein